MNHEEMLKALDLDATALTEESAVHVDTQATENKVPKEANAMTMDLWTKRQGRQLRERFDAEIAEGGDRFSKRPVHDLSAVDLADFHLGTFDPTPELIPENACSDSLKWRYFNELIDTPGFHALRENTVLDDASTDLAIERLSEGLVNLRGKEKKDGDAPADGSGDGSSQDDFSVGRAAANAVNQAKQDVQDFQDAREGLGIGSGPGAGGQYDVKQAIDLYKRLRKDQNLKKIMNLAGKYILFGQSQQRRRVRQGYDDMVGVTIGDNISRLTQSEFLALGIPELEDDVCRRLLDKQAMIQEFRGTEPVAKGPMIWLIDNSGSMSATDSDGYSRIQHAKAIGLAFAYLARQQNRWCALVSWSGKGQIASIVLAPGRWNHEALMMWLTGFFAGGTDVPLAELPGIYESMGAPVGKTDIGFITDDSVYIDPSAIDAFSAWKKEVDAKVISLVVAANSGGMAKISDEVHEIRSLGTNDAVGRVLSI